MNPFVYWISIFYHWYYDKPRRKKDAYESAIAIVIMFFFINIVSILTILNFWDSFSLGFLNLSKLESYAVVIISLVPFYFLLSVLAPKEKVQIINYETLNRFKDRTIALTYWIASLLLFFVVAFYLRRKQLGMN